MTAHPNVTAVLGTLVLTMGLFIVAACEGNAQDKLASERILSLSATAVLQIKPDSVYINTGITTLAQTAGQSLRENSLAMEKIIASLRQSGINQQDIQTTNFSVGPHYSRTPRSRNVSVITGFQVVNSVRIRVQNIASLGQILDRVVGLGANRINSISFNVTETEELKQKVRKMALEKIKHKAEFYAKNMGVSLGRVMAISENYVSHRPSPYMRSFAKMSGDMAVPISAGKGSLSATVQVSWELK